MNLSNRHLIMKYFEEFVNESKSKLPLFDFDSKYKKDDIIQFLILNGNSESRKDDEYWLRRFKLPQLEKYAKIYNANVLNGGDGNYSEYFNDEGFKFQSDIINNAAIKTVKRLNASGVDLDTIIGNFQTYLLKVHANQAIRSLREFSTQLQKKVDDYINSLIGGIVGTAKEANDFEKFLDELYTEFVKYLKSIPEWNEYVKTLK